MVRVMSRATPRAMVRVIGRVLVYGIGGLGSGIWGLWHLGSEIRVLRFVLGDQFWGLGSGLGSGVWDLESGIVIRNLGLGSEQKASTGGLGSEMGSGV